MRSVQRARRTAANATAGFPSEVEASVAKTFAIAGGITQIQRNLVARKVLGQRYY